MTDALRDALNKAIVAGETFRSIERETGIVRQSLMPFARGEQTLLLNKADALAAHFGLELKPKRKGN
ncbi:MAG: hypothetical protein ACKVHE_25725 [Planctomycetales bacterium]